MSSSSRQAIGPKKARYDLIPANALHQVVLALTLGAEKHKDNPWEDGGRSWRGEFSAAMRHLWAFHRGETNDPESGLCHLAHAAARVLILLELFMTEIGDDDMSTPQRKGETHATRTGQPASSAMNELTE